MRHTGIVLGWLCVALGVVGIFVPGLPTTCFLLAASWLFARTSPALRRRLHANRWLGPYLKAAEGRSMPLRAKVISFAAIWAGTGFAVHSGAVSGTPAAVALVAAALTGKLVLALGVRTAPRRAAA